MKKIQVILFFCMGLLFLPLHAQWFPQNSNTGNYLYSVQFLNYDTGFAVGGNINESVFLRTTNGGNDWTVTTNDQTQWLYDVVFIDDSTGIACGYAGVIYKTTDRGITWNAKPSQTTEWLYTIAHKGGDTLFATGENGEMVRSVNRGDNWSHVTSNTSLAMYDLHFYNSTYGAATGYTGEMIYTTDGGNNWAVKLMPTIASITGVWMLSPDTIWTCGLSGKIYKTENAGASFIDRTDTIKDFNAIFFTDDMNGYLAGGQIILQTTNGGNTWEAMTYPVAEKMNDIYFTPDNRVGYAVGQNGRIIKYVNTIGIEENTGTNVPIYPNPAEDAVFIPVDGNFDIRIFDLSGRMVKTGVNYSSTTPVETGELIPGMYIVEIWKNKQRFTSRIVKK